jgi:FAD:protein FMN transferase
MRCSSAPRSASDRIGAALVCLAVAMAAASRPARGDETLLAESDAPAAVFPAADRFERAEVPSTPELRRRIAQRLGDVKPTTWEPVYKIATAYAGDRRLGRAVIVEEIGKHRPITLAVGIDDDRKVSGVAVLTYREAYGGEVRSRRFLSQYRGKTAADPLQPSGDIVNITGATLSARAVGRAVKKAIAVLDEIPPPDPSAPRRLDPAADRGGRGPLRVREAHYVMGTILAVTVDAPSEAVGRAWIREAVREARRLDEELTSFDERSALARLNRHAGGGAQRVSPDLYRVISLSRDLSADTGGTFDATVAPLVRLWQRAAREGRWPAPPEIEAARRTVGYGKIRLAPPDEIELPAGAAIELGGIGKGYAADRLAAALHALGVESALVSFGESSIVAIGPPPGEAPWAIWVRDGASLAGPLLLRDAALSTSAALADGVRVRERRIGHIIDPRTGRPLERSVQATVVAGTGADAEAWSKALVVDPPGALRALASRPGLAALVLEPSATRRTANFAARTSWRGSRRRTADGQPSRRWLRQGSSRRTLASLSRSISASITPSPSAARARTVPQGSTIIELP